jgi:hypothetical protein
MFPQAGPEASAKQHDFHSECHSPSGTPCGG